MPRVIFHVLFVVASSWLGPIGFFPILAAAITHYVVDADLRTEAGLDRTRRWLFAGNPWRHLYLRGLRYVLDWVDSFFHEANKAEFSWPSPFGNQEKRPYWTAWSFDRCALLALIYPPLSLFAVWIWTGEGGKIGELLGLHQAEPWWRRGIAALGAAIVFLALWQAVRPRARWSLVWLVLSAAFAVGIGAAGIIGGNGAVALVGAGAVAGGAVFGRIPKFAVHGVAGFGVASAFVVGVAVSVTGIAAALLGFAAAFSLSCFIALSVAANCEREHKLGQFWLPFWWIMLAVCYFGMSEAASVGVPEDRLIFTLMFVLVPLVNVPFDWFSLGLTRALLRRGAEPRAPSLFLLGSADFFLGLLLLILLAIVLIVVLQATDIRIVGTGGRPMADVVAVLDKIAIRPRDPANYWAYLILFTTLIPSALNLVIGTVSLVVWLLPRPIRAWALSLLNAEVDEGIRIRITLLLAGQVGVGALAACLLLWGFWEGLLMAHHAVPDVLAGLRWFSLAVAAALS